MNNIRETHVKKLIIFLLMTLVTNVNAESNEAVEEESKISTIGQDGRTRN